MKLNWAEIKRGVQEAHGGTCTYLITSDDHGVVMTRFSAGILINAAAEAALNAISLGSYSETSQAMAVAQLQVMAAQFERGQDVFAQPRWAHERSTP